MDRKNLIIARDTKLYFSRGYKYCSRKEFNIKLVFGPKEDIETRFVSFKKDGCLKVKEWYPWDGASGPTWDTFNSMIGSLIHDVGYQLIRLGHLDSSYKELFDQLLHDLCAEDGMWEWRADYWEWAVLNFGTGSTRPSSEPKVEVAP